MENELRTPIFIPKFSLLINKWRRENESWRRTLVFLNEEDIILKAGISDVLKNMISTDEDILKMVEQFHSNLLSQSDTARFLRKEVDDMQRQLIGEFYGDSDWLNSLNLQQRRLRIGIKNMELEFLKLKFDFNNYIDRILQNGI